MTYNLTFFRGLYESHMKACFFVVEKSTGLQNPDLSRFVLRVSLTKSKITAGVWCFNIHAATWTLLQTLEGLAEDTERVFGASQEKHDAPPSENMTATTISTAIQQTAFEALFQVRIASVHQTAYAWVCVFICVYLESCCFVSYTAVHMRHCC